MANVDGDWGYATQTVTNPTVAAPIIRRTYTDTGYRRTNTRTTTPGYGRA